MAKKKPGSSAPGKQTAWNGRYIPDHLIDYSDIPASTDEELKRARPVGRPRSGKPWKRLVSIRLELSLLEDIRKLAGKCDKPYQTWIHETLVKAVRRKKSA